MELGLNMIQDSSPDIDGGPSSPSTGLVTAYRDGAQILSQPGYGSTMLTGQPQQPGTYRLVYDQDVSGAPLTQSTVTHTDITVPYTPTPDPEQTLPSGDICYAQGRSTTACSILPVLNLNYQLATDDTNTSHGPVAMLVLTVGHQSYGTAGAQATVTGSTVSVSFDNGQTWTPAPVIPIGQGRYVALWKNAAAKGAMPSLRTTATDVLGGSITQTVANAYTIG